MMRVVLMTMLLGTMVSGSDYEMDGDLRLRLEHSLDEGRSWESRGSIAITRSKNGNGAIQQESLHPDNFDRIKELCDKNKLYLIKVHGEGVEELQSYASACSLLEAGLTETLVLHIDWRGNVIAVNLYVRPDRETATKDKNREKFDTKVVVQNMENGPTPDTAAFIQKMDEEKERKMHGETKDNRSFFSKYWMYIVPVCIFMAINSVSGPENGGGR